MKLKTCVDTYAYGEGRLITYNLDAVLIALLNRHPESIISAKPIKLGMTATPHQTFRLIANYLRNYT